MPTHTLMFGWEYPPVHLGGLGVACQGLVKGLVQNNVKVTLALPHPGDEDDSVDFLHPTEEVFSEMVETIRVESNLSPYLNHEEFLKRAKGHMAHQDKDMSSIYGNDLNEAVHYFTEMSVAMTKNVEADVVHCHDWMTYGAGAKAARHHNKPLVAHIHATELDRTHFSPNEWIYGLERQGFMAADRIIAVSNYTKGILVDHYGINADKISVVHNGATDEHSPHQVHLNSESRKSKAPMVLFLGRLALQKGAVQFLEMAARVHQHRPDVQFVVAGDGHMLPELVDRSIQMGLRDNMVFSGKVDYQEGRKLYAQASCFVMPSLSEPFGLVALEAIAQGTPVILSKQSGASEVIPHSFRVDFWNTDLMADCCLTILRDEPLARQLRSYAPDVLRTLTWGNQAGRVSTIYSDVISS